MAQNLTRPISPIMGGSRQQQRGASHWRTLGRLLYLVTSSNVACALLPVGMVCTGILGGYDSFKHMSLASQLPHLVVTGEREAFWRVVYHICWQFLVISTPIR